MAWWNVDDSDSEADYDRYDLDSYQQRPNPKANRRRTKQTPNYENTQIGRVITVNRGRYLVALVNSAEETTVTATKSSLLRREQIVTGDLVELVGDLSGSEGSLARIVKLLTRTSILRRSADDVDTIERIVVANAEQMLIVVAAENPTPRPRLVDRYLVAAFDAGITPLLCITKTDLADPIEFIKEFDCLELPIITSRQDNPPVDEIRKLLQNKVTVVVGHSGVGKSTLVNAVVPGADRATGEVNLVTGRGRHTSSSSYALRVPEVGFQGDDFAGEGFQGDGFPEPTFEAQLPDSDQTTAKTEAQTNRKTAQPSWLIDTPGVRSFGLGHIDPANVIKAFAARAKLADPKAGEISLAKAHDWEIVERVSAGELGESGKKRIESLTAILQNLGKIFEA